MTTQSVYTTTVETCEICHGRGLTPAPNGGQEQCICQIWLQIASYVGPVMKNDMLTDTKLLEPLKAGRSLLIECDDHRVWRSHLKTALVKRKDITKTWRIVTPDELMTLSYSAEREKIYTVDLLIIQAPVFLHYDKASQQHEYVISTRNGMNRPTWIVTNSLRGFVESRNAKLTESFSKLIRGLHVMKLTLAETQPLLKKRSTPTVNLSPGVGVSGVDPGLLRFKPDINQRVAYLKEHINERRKALVDNGDDAES